MGVVRLSKIVWQNDVTGKLATYKSITGLGKIKVTFTSIEDLKWKSIDFVGYRPVTTD